MAMSFKERFRFRSSKMTREGVSSLALNNSAQLGDSGSTHLQITRANFKSNPSRSSLKKATHLSSSLLNASLFVNRSVSKEMVKNKLLRQFHTREDLTPTVQHSSYNKLLPPLRRKSCNSQYLRKHATCITKSNIKLLESRHMKKGLIHLALNKNEAS